MLAVAFVFLPCFGFDSCLYVLDNSDALSLYIVLFLGVPFAVHNWYLFIITATMIDWALITSQRKSIHGMSLGDNPIRHKRARHEIPAAFSTHLPVDVTTICSLGHSGVLV